MIREPNVENWPLEQLQGPTLNLHGATDPSAPYGGSVAAVARIADAELVTFEGVGHELSLTRA